MARAEKVVLWNAEPWHVDYRRGGANAAAAGGALVRLGAMKSVFAWLPVRRRVRAGCFFAPRGWYWLRRVTVMWTLAGWVAYADANDGAGGGADAAG